MKIDRIEVIPYRCQFLQDSIGQGTGHTNLDFYENLVQEDLMKNSVIIAIFVYLSTMMDEKMPRKIYNH